MKKIILFYLLSMLIAITLIGCGRTDDKNTDVLFPNLTLNNEFKGKIQLSELFDDYSIIQLPTSDSTLISTRDIKIIKRKGYFYIKSINDIFIFDKSGNYQSTLSCTGNGPGEYAGINDFAIAERENNVEIWIADMKKIMRYKGKDLRYLGAIQTDFFVNQVCYVNDSTILCTTNENKYFRVIDMEGKQRGDFFDVDFPNTLQKQHGFKPMGNWVTYQFSHTDEAMAYNVEKRDFSIVKILPLEDYFQTTQIAHDYFDKYDMGFASKLREKYVGIASYKYLNNDISLVSNWQDNKMKITLGNVNEKAKTYIYYPASESVIENNILKDADPMFLTTQVCCDSDDSFLFLDSYSEESNPRLLEVRTLKQ